MSKGSRASWTLARAKLGKVLDAIGAKDVVAQLEDRVAKVRVADGADGDSL